MPCYTAYFDDSGHEGKDCLVCAGLVTDREKADVFDLAWKSAISPLPYLHMKDFAAGERDFATWKGRLAEKQKLIERAARVLAEASFQTFSVVLDMDGYRRANDQIAVSQCIGFPFTLCVRLADVLVNRWGNQHGLEKRVPLVIEKRAEGQGDIRDTFLRDGINPPTFEEKQLPQLQAADLISLPYHARFLRSPNFERLGRLAIAQIPAWLASADTYKRPNGSMAVSENLVI